MTRIVIITDDPEIASRGYSIQTTIMDAFYEFRANRGPTASEYVNKRYPETPEYSWLNREEKIKQVNTRNRLATILHSAEIEIKYTGE